MNPKRRRQTESLFHSALGLDEIERAAFLDKACAGDEDLRREVGSLLAAHEQGASFLQDPAAEILAESMAADAAGSRPGLEQPLQQRMSGKIGAAPWWMYVVAASFLALFAFNPYLWIYGPEDIRGAEVRFAGGATEIRAVRPGSEMDRVGLRPGDLVLTIDGQPVGKGQDWVAVKANMEVGKAQHWDIARGSERLILTVIPQTVRRTSFYSASTLVYNIGICICYLLVGLFIAFRRPHDPVARVGAWFLMTASIAFGFGFGWAATWRSLPAFAQGLLWIPQVSRFVLEGIFVTFAAIFPRRLFRSRWPWVLIWAPVLATLPWRISGVYAVIYRPEQATSSPSWLFQVTTLRAIIYLIAGAILLIVSYRRLADLNEKRRLRVLVAGTLVTLISSIVVVWGLRSGHMDASYHLYSLIVTLFLPFTLACPVAFAYSILRHRTFDIQVIIRQGLQYALARGTVLALIPALAAILLGDLVINSEEPLVSILRSRGWMYATLGGLAALIYVRRKQWLERLDRRFFRDRYDAQRVLREVVGEIRAGRSFDRVAPRMAAQVEAALHPKFVALMVRKPNEPAYSPVAASPAGVEVLPLPAESKLMALIRVLGKPLEVLHADSGWLQQRLPHEETDFLRRAGIDLLVPIATAPGSMEALLALGVKRSEEPYTREDQELLEAIASSLALLLEQRVPEPERAQPQMFEECPQCGTCYDSGASRCAYEQAALKPVRVPRLLAGRYRLERRRGRGGMGAVYEATDSALERRVAVKVIRDDLVGSPDAAERFRREARAAASFTHPNVVTVHDFGVEAQMHAFLVMELLEGSTLREELRRLKRFDPGRTVQILRAVCAAVEAAHRRQIIHRDLKPENIFLARTQASDGSAQTVKVLDFGIAKFLPLRDEAAETGATMTETGPGVLVGTAAYMSPEQLLGESVTAGWDLWALGVVAYEMLTGALPFPSSSNNDWRGAILSGRFLPVSHHVPQTPERWQGFFVRAFAISRSKGPASAQEFIAELEAALS